MFNFFFFFDKNNLGCGELLRFQGYGGEIRI